MALRRSRSTWPTWLGFCGTFTVRWWAIVHESLASHASSDFWRKTQGLERQQMGTDSDVFFCQFGRCVWCLWNTAHDISWPLKLGPGRSLEYQLPLIHVHQCGTLTQFRSLNLIWVHKDLCILFGFKLCFGYCILEIFEPLTFSVAAAIILLNNALAVSSIPHDSLFSTANRCLGHASTRIQDHHDANQRVATNKESLDLRSAVLILIYFDCPFVSF